MSRLRLCLFAIVVSAAVLSSPSPHAQVIGNASSFAIVGGQAVTVNGAGSIIGGDVGSSPLAAISGFPGFPPNILGAVVSPPFGIHPNDGPAIAAEFSADTLFNSAIMAPAGAVVLGGLNMSLANSTGVPGHYTPGKYTDPGGVVTIPGAIFLDTPGLYIFSFTSALTTAVGSNVFLGVGVDPCNVWWRVPTQPTLNGATFSGTVVSNALIAVGANAIVVGRLLTTAAGSVTLAGNDRIGGCPALAPAAPPLPAPVPTATDLFIIKSHATPFVVGTNGVFTIRIFNNGTQPSSGGITVTDTLPAGLTFVSANGNGSWTCSANGQIVTCTTPASVQTGSLANVITLTVLPTAAAAPVVTNTATVSGGNDSILTNNTTLDVTVVALGVPTLPEWAFLLMAGLLAWAGIVALRRRLV